MKKIIIINATLSDATGTVCAEAICTYFAFSQEKVAKDMHFKRCMTEDGM